MPVLKVISHFAWNCAEYISCRAYEIRREGIVKEKYGKIIHKSQRILGTAMIYR